MIIKKRVDLGSTTYYVEIEVEYKKKGDILELCLKNYQDDYYDGGDLSILLEKLASKYSTELAKKYNAGIFFLNDALYLYDNIPFISGVYDFYQNAKDNISDATGYISARELDQIINMKNIKMPNKQNFKLYDGRTGE